MVVAPEDRTWACPLITDAPTGWAVASDRPSTRNGIILADSRIPRRTRGDRLDFFETLMQPTAIPPGLQNQAPQQVRPSPRNTAAQVERMIAQHAMFLGILLRPGRRL